MPACDKLGSSRIDDRHELLPGDRRSPSTTVLTIGGERHLLGPATVLSRLSCFIAMSSYGGDALIAFLCTQLDQHGHRVRGAKRPVCAVFDISGSVLEIYWYHTGIWPFSDSFGTGMV